MSAIARFGVWRAAALVTLLRGARVGARRDRVS